MFPAYSLKLVKQNKKKLEILFVYCWLLVTSLSQRIDGLDLTTREFVKIEKTTFLDSLTYLHYVDSDCLLFFFTSFFITSADDNYWYTWPLIKNSSNFICTNTFLNICSKKIANNKKDNMSVLVFLMIDINQLCSDYWSNQRRWFQVVCVFCKTFDYDFKRPRSLLLL